MDREASNGQGLIPRVDVLGVEISAIDLDTAVSTIAGWIRDDERQYVCVTGVHGVIESQRDPELKQIHNASGMTTPDGMPLVWCGRNAGAHWVERVYGPDLLLRVCEASVAGGWKHFFYGAGPGVAEELSRRMQARYPGMEVVGTLSPPFRDLTEPEAAEIAQIINDSDADVVWVGLSTPKQERWMSHFRSVLDPQVLIGIGAAFDIHAGMVRQAPRWMQRSGLEWSFRLMTEPRRLWRRYLRANPEFVRRILLNPPKLIDMSDAGAEQSAVL